MVNLKEKDLYTADWQDKHSDMWSRFMWHKRECFEPTSFMNDQRNNFNVKRKKMENVMSCHNNTILYAFYQSCDNNNPMIFAWFFNYFNKFKKEIIDQTQTENNQTIAWIDQTIILDESIQKKYEGSRRNSSITAMQSIEPAFVPIQYLIKVLFLCVFLFFCFAFFKI